MFKCMAESNIYCDCIVERDLNDIYNNNLNYFCTLIKKWQFLTIKYYFSISLSEIKCIICWFFVIMCAIYYQFLSENFFYTI